MEKSESSLDVKIDAINGLNPSDIEKETSQSHTHVHDKLTSLFKDTDVTENKVLDLVGITFVIESLILSEEMSNEKLNNLNQDQVENLALELYLSVEQKRSKGDGYSEMCETANEVINKHLSRFDKVV